MNPSAARRLLGPVVVSLVVAQPLAAQSDSSRTAEVHAEATATRSVRPDVATFAVTFSDTGSTPTAAGRAVALRAAAVRRALEKLGIPHDSLFTRSSWWWWPQRMTLVYGSRPLKGLTDAFGRPVARSVPDTTYRSTDAIEVRIHDLTKIGPAIDSIFALGITEISPVSFRATDVSAAQEAALREATERARRQATAIAEAGGGRLGRTILLSSAAENDNRYRGFSLAQVSVTGGAGQGTDVVAPTVTVSVTVYGRWELMKDR